jgi:hypothetical protein
MAIVDLSPSVDSQVEIEDVEMVCAEGNVDVGEGTSEEDGLELRSDATRRSLRCFMSSRCKTKMLGC